MDRPFAPSIGGLMCLSASQLVLTDQTSHDKRVKMGEWWMDFCPIYWAASPAAQASSPPVAV
jgi:hypothetical protein